MMGGRPSLGMQPLWLTSLARILLFAAVPVLAVAILLSNTQIAALRRAWRKRPLTTPSSRSREMVRYRPLDDRRPGCRTSVSSGAPM